MDPFRQAFHQLLDTLREVEQNYLCAERNITSPADIASGQHYLTHLLKAALNLYVDNDPNFPHFAPIIMPTQKLGGDGPDHHVLFAPLNDSHNYKIRGKMSGEVYLSFTIHTTDGEGGWGTSVVSDLNDANMQFEADGSFEITLSRDRQDGNWLKMDDGAAVIITRHYFENERPALLDPPPKLHIEALGETTRPLLPYSPETMAAKLQASIRYIRGHTLERPVQTAETTPEWFSTTPNQLPQPMLWENTDGGGFGAVDNAYAATLYLLGPDQALIMEGRLPPCRYANVCLWNRYLQTFDYRYHNIGLNRKQMNLKDNHYRICVSSKQPKSMDWLDTSGQEAGLIYWRFLLPEGEIEQPVCKVAPLSQVV